MEWYAILGVVLIIFAAAIAAFLLYRLSLNRKGVLGHKKVQGILKSFGIIRNYKVLENVRLKTSAGETVIENLLIGFFGILLVRTFNDTAEYYGDDKSESWTKVLPKSQLKVMNAHKKMLSDGEALREIFSKNDIYSIKLETATVFCGNAKKSLIGINNCPNLMTLKEFRSYIKKAKFEKDNDVDVPALYSLITGGEK